MFLKRPQARDILSMELSGMDSFHHALLNFQPIGLEETVRDASLMRRIDIKYAIRLESLAALMNACTGKLRIMEIGGSRVSRYHTQYYDTPEMAFYHEHHSDRPKRRKVRMRTYCDSGGSFLEVKQRQSDGHTLKKRIGLNEMANDRLETLLADPVFSTLGSLFSDRLLPSLSVKYCRATLVDIEKQERITIDSGITFHHDGEFLELFGLAVVEVKQTHPGPSYVCDYMRSHGIRPGSMSKYCLGVACLHRSVKKNLFKARISRILKLTNYENTASLRR